jgi:predicted peptidase
MSKQTAGFCRLPEPCISLHYLQYLPAGYEESEETYPLVIFLHGAGERGEDLDLVRIHGWPRYAEEGTEYPFVMISPQLPAGCHWCGQINTLNGLLDHLLATLRVDPKRVYLTGLSDGGTGAWVWLMNNASRFAALIPVCGAGVPSLAHRLTDIAIWAFHGDRDDTVPASGSRDMYEAIKAAGGTKVKYTELPGVWHDSWIKAYKTEGLVDWLYEQHK